MIFNENGIKVHYEIFGEDKTLYKPLLVLHGWMAQIESMAPIYQFFRQSRKVIVLDFPGQSGKSDTLVTPWGVPEYAQMVRNLIKELQIDGCDVIGHSFGGRVIIYLSSLEPSLFHRIILTDAAGIKPKMSLHKLWKIYSYKIMKKIAKGILPKEKYEKQIEKMRQKRGSADYARLQNDVMRSTFQQVIQLDLTKNLKKIQNSTLLVWGEEDQDTPLWMAKKMEKEISDSGLVVLKNAGHFSYLDQPKQYLVIAENFLNS